MRCCLEVLAGEAAAAAVPVGEIQAADQLRVLGGLIRSQMREQSAIAEAAGETINNQTAARRGRKLEDLPHHPIGLDVARKRMQMPKRTVLTTASTTRRGDRCGGGCSHQAPPFSAWAACRL